MKNAVFGTKQWEPLRLHRITVHRRRLLSTGLLLSTVLTLNGFQTVNARANEPAIVVKMLDIPASFEPAVITIDAGQAIRWENVGLSVHHAGSNPSTAIKGDDVANPDGAKPFDSGFLKPGESFTYTFTTPGVYKYVCAAHETSGMLGEVIVR